MERYLGPHARIVGLDIDPSCKAAEEDQIAVRIGDQSDERFLASVVDEFGTPDVVLDDGSHRMEHVRATFAYLYPLVATEGVYFVEDLHTAYWRRYGGGLGRDGTFIEIAKQLIDELNADLSRGAVSPTEFTASTMSMHFYDSCVVFERGRHTRRRQIRHGMTPRGAGLG